MTRVAAATLGCKVNQCDTQVLLAALSAQGYEIKNFDEEADVYIINTCTVTHVSDRKSRQLIRRAHRQNPKAKVAVCGCYAKTDPDAVQRIDGVALVFDARDIEAAVAAISAPAPPYSNESASTLHDGLRRTRAYVKIQDGCDRHCAYCAVPHARGPVASKPVGEILREISDLTVGGCREIVLTGIHVASYGKDVNNMSLATLLERISGEAALPDRLRLSSIEPYAVDETLMAAMRGLPQLCDHFHLSLQSGCDRTLAAMNRRYTAEDYLLAAKRLRGLYPDAALTTDAMVGFPGETERDFLESCAFIERVGFMRLHVFPFSRRKGTKAASLDGQLPEEEKHARARHLAQIGERMSRAFHEGFIGRDMPVLLESGSVKHMDGHTSNYMSVRIHPPYQGGACVKCILPVRLLRYERGQLHGDKV